MDTPCAVIDIPCVEPTEAVPSFVVDMLAEAASLDAEEPPVR